MAKTSAKKLLGPKFKKLFAKKRVEEISLEDFGGGGNLPDGIENGVAKLVSIKIGAYGESTTLAGKPFFMLRGVTVAPATHEGLKVRGIQESFVLEPLCDTSGRKRETEEEHIDYMLAVLQQFGVDTGEIDAEELEEEDFFAELIADGVYFRFRTWKGRPSDQFPNPRVNIEFLGACEYEEGDEGVAEEVEDDTPEEEDEDEEPAWEKNDRKSKRSAAASTKKPVKEKGKKKPPPEDDDDDDEEEDEEADYSEVTDLDLLAELAEDQDDIAARERLVELGVEAGLSKKKLEALDSWYDVAVAIEEAGEDEEDEDEDEDDEDEDEDEDDEEGRELVPEKGQGWQYKPPGARKKIPCVVTAVAARRKTCTLKAKDGKIYKDVAWAALMRGR